MQIGEIGLFTGDVLKMSNFYKSILQINNDSNDDTIQFLITEGTGLPSKDNPRACKVYEKAGMEHNGIDDGRMYEITY